MKQLHDSIAIYQPRDKVLQALSDLQSHAVLDPDGFKYYRFLSPLTSGEGARAAVLVNLLGFWLPGELEVKSSTPNSVVLVATTQQARLELCFTAEGGPDLTRVFLEVRYERVRLPPWRVRTRLKQHFRLEQDVRTLAGRFLGALKRRLEEHELEGQPRKKPAPAPLPVDPRLPAFEV